VAEKHDQVALIACSKLLTADVGVLLLMLHAEWEATTTTSQLRN